MKEIRSGAKRVLKELRRCKNIKEFIEFLQNVDAAILVFIRMIALIVGLYFGKKHVDEDDSQNKTSHAFNDGFVVKSVNFYGETCAPFKYTPLYC